MIEIQTDMVLLSKKEYEELKNREWFQGPATLFGVDIKDWAWLQSYTMSKTNMTIPEFVAHTKRLAKVF